MRGFRLVEVHENALCTLRTCSLCCVSTSIHMEVSLLSRRPAVRGVSNRPTEQPHELFKTFSTCAFSFILTFKCSLCLLCGFDIFTCNPVTNNTIGPMQCIATLYVPSRVLSSKIKVSHKLPGSHWFKSTPFLGLP